MSELARRSDGPTPWGAGDLPPGRYSVLDVSSLGSVPTIKAIPGVLRRGVLIGEEGKRLLSASRRKRRDGTTEGGWTGPGSIPDWPPIGCGVIWFVADCIGNQDRRHRFLVLLAVTMLVTAGG